MGVQHGQSQPWLDITGSKSFLRNEERSLKYFNPQISSEGKIFQELFQITPVLQNTHKNSHKVLWHKPCFLTGLLLKFNSY